MHDIHGAQFENFLDLGADVRKRGGAIAGDGVLKDNAGYIPDQILESLFR